VGCLQMFRVMSILKCLNLGAIGRGEQRAIHLRFSCCKRVACMDFASFGGSSIGGLLLGNFFKRPWGYRPKRNKRSLK
jgi:hypothetical protein